MRHCTRIVERVAVRRDFDEAGNGSSRGARHDADVGRIGKIDALNARVACVAGPLTDQVGGRAGWEFTVFDVDEANAFALPGGKIGVYRGLFKVATTPDELAAVLGHEIGHVKKRHGNERVSSQVVTNLGLQAVGVARHHDSRHTRPVQVVHAHAPRMVAEIAGGHALPAPSAVRRRVPRRHRLRGQGCVAHGCADATGAAVQPPRVLRVIPRRIVGSLGESPRGAHQQDGEGNHEPDRGRDASPGIHESGPLAERATAVDPGEGSPIRTCTAHVIQVLPEEELLVMAWYNGGVRVLDYSGLADLGPAGVSVGVGGQTLTPGIQEVGHCRFADSSLWSAKVMEVEEDGSFYIFGGDMTRALDVWRFDPDADGAVDGGTWLSASQAALLPSGGALDAGYTPFCLLPAE